MLDATAFSGAGIVPISRRLGAEHPVPVKRPTISGVVDLKSESVAGLSRNQHAERYHELQVTAPGAILARSPRIDRKTLEPYPRT